MTEETALKRQIKDYLKLKGWFVYHNLAGIGVYPGLADITAIKAGRVLQLEVKIKSGGRVSQHQQEFWRQWTGHGGEYYVVHGVEEVIRICEDEK